MENRKNNLVIWGSSAATNLILGGAKFSLGSVMFYLILAPVMHWPNFDQKTIDIIQYLLLLLISIFSIYILVKIALKRFARIIAFFVVIGGLFTLLAIHFLRVPALSSQLSLLFYLATVVIIQESLSVLMNLSNPQKLVKSANYWRWVILIFCLISLLALFFLALLLVASWLLYLFY